jgi:hypothetical protein
MQATDVPLVRFFDASSIRGYLLMQATNVLLWLYFDAINRVPPVVLFYANNRCSCCTVLF